MTEDKKIRRSIRSTAGNRYQALLRSEEKDEFYEGHYGGFTEEEDDNDFSGIKKISLIWIQNELKDRAARTKVSLTPAPTTTKTNQKERAQTSQKKLNARERKTCTKTRRNQRGKKLITRASQRRRSQNFPTRPAASAKAQENTQLSRGTFY